MNQPRIPTIRFDLTVEEAQLILDTLLDHTSPRQSMGLIGKLMQQSNVQARPALPEGIHPGDIPDRAAEPAGEPAGGPVNGSGTTTPETSEMAAQGRPQQPQRRAKSR